MEENIAVKVFRKNDAAINRDCAQVLGVDCLRDIIWHHGCSTAGPHDGDEQVSRVNGITLKETLENPSHPRENSRVSASAD